MYMILIHTPGVPWTEYMCNVFKLVLSYLSCYWLRLDLVSIFYFMLWLDKFGKNDFVLMLMSHKWLFQNYYSYRNVRKMKSKIKTCVIFYLTFMCWNTFSSLFFDSYIDSIGIKWLIWIYSKNDDIRLQIIKNINNQPI